MKNIFRILVVSTVSTLILLFVGCSDSSSPSVDESASHPLNGLWDIEVSFIDTKGIEKTVKSPIVCKITIANNNATIEKVPTDGNPVPGIFSFNGNDFEIGKDAWKGRMLSNDSFTMSTSYNVMGYDKLQYDGIRKK